MADTDDFIRNLKEINEELGVFSRAVNAASRATDAQEKQTDAINKQTKATNDQTAAAQKNAAIEQALAQTTGQLNAGFNLLKDMLGKVLAIGGQFADTLLDTSEKVTKYTGVMNSVADAAADLAGQFGIFGKALGVLIKITALVTEEQFEFIQGAIEAKDSLAKFGANIGMTTEQLAQLTLNAGRTMKEFEKIAKPLGSMNTGILAIGTTASEGAKNFLELSNVGKEARERFRKLGISFEELTQGQADYIAIMAKGGRTFAQNEIRDANNQSRLQKASLEYLQTLQALADITGKNVDQAKEEYAQVQATVEMSVINNQLTQKKLDLEREQEIAKNAGDTERVAALQAQIDTINKQTGSFEKLNEVFIKAKSADIGAALQSFFTTGVMKPEMVQRFAGVDLAKFKKQFEEGTFDESAFLKEFFSNAQVRMQMFGQGALLAENIGEYLKMLGFSQELVNTLTVAAQAGGSDKYVDKILAAFEARRSNLPPDEILDTRNTVVETELETRVKKEQRVAEGIDGALVKWKKLTEAAATATNVFTLLITAVTKLEDFLGRIFGFFGGDGGGATGAVGGSSGAAGVGGNAGLPVTGVGASSSLAGGTENVQIGQQVKVGDEIRKGGTVSWRTNNPGNISYGDLAKSYGAIGVWKNPNGDEQQRTTGIAIFPTMEHGYNAMMSLWRRPMYRNLTIDEGVAQWTGTTGLGSVYAKDLARAAGVSVNTIIGQLSDQQLTAMTNKQKVWEGFKEGQVLKGAKGGYFSGPSTGYPVEMHGEEILIPLNPNSILAELGQKTTDQVNAESKGIQTTMVESMKDMSVSNKVFMDMISTKLDTMISKLDAGNDTRTKILRHTYT